jgi:hypothetical protein
MTGNLFPSKTIQESFEEWIERHQNVYRRFVDMAREAKRRGRRRWSTKAMIEVYRWEQSGAVDAVDGFKFKNAYFQGLRRIRRRRHGLQRTAGWDMLLVREFDGFQTGVQAKLKANLEVLWQVVNPPMQPKLRMKLRC